MARRLYNSPFKKAWRRLPTSLQNVVKLVRDRFSDSDTPFEQIPRVYISLLCNLRCPYCSDGLAYDKTEMKYHRLSANEWLPIIDSLPGNAVIFTGGEPTLHPELPDIINRCNKTYVCLYTNLAYDVPKFVNQLRKPIRFFTSFHPNNKQVTVDKSSAAIEFLKQHPMCIEVTSHHLIAHPSNGEAPELAAYKQKFKKRGTTLLIYDDQFEVNRYGPEMCDFKEKRRVRCTMERFLIGPDGKRHMCVSKMVRRTTDSHVPSDIKRPEMICNEYGLCSPCDEVAEITFLQGEMELSQN